MVLVHHGVDALTDREDPHRLVVSASHLESQLRLMLRLRYRFVTVEELFAEHGPHRPLPGTAVLTFDDGLEDNLRVAAPLLNRLGIRATFYVCPGMWGAQHSYIPGPPGRLITRGEASALCNEAGMELGSHALSHPDLRTLSDRQLAHELSTSKAAIEEITGVECKTIAYPFGLSDERVHGATAHAGYQLALGWGPGRWTPMDVPRVPGPPRHGGSRLALKLLGVRRRAR